MTKWIVRDCTLIHIVERQQLHLSLKTNSQRVLQATVRMHLIYFYVPYIFLMGFELYTYIIIIFYIIYIFFT